MKLVSINPVDIVGAEQLWVYNVKNRKLGRYVAEDQGGVLGVKGTSITGFNESKSTQKTLRKPEEQIKDLMGSGKVKLRSFIDNIKSKEQAVNGRINIDTIILRIMR